MNVLWLAPHPIPNIENQHPAPWIATLAELLAKKGVSITIVTQGKRLKKDVEKFSFDYYDLIVLNVPTFTLDLLTLFRKRIRIINNFLENSVTAYDLIHVHGTEYQYGSALNYSNMRNVAVVLSIQGLIHKYKAFIKDIISIRRLNWELTSIYEKAEIRNGKFFMCRTDWDKGSIYKLNPSAKVFEVWEVMRPEFYNANFSLGKNILFSGGQNSLKGLDQCLIVFNKIVKELGATKLHIVGNCSYRYVLKIKNKYKLNNIHEGNLIIHGMLSANQIITLYQDCYCLYHPSLIDNSPNSVCEAQLAGLPVVARKTGGVSSLLKNGVTGFLLTSDLNEHVCTLIDLNNNVKLQNRIRTFAKAEAEVRHNPETIVNNVLECYKEISQYDN